MCHTIITEVKDGQVIYNVNFFFFYNNNFLKAASPDELALVNFAKFSGCEYVGMDEDNNMQVSFKGKILKFRLLQVLEFNSKRYV